VEKKKTSPWLLKLKNLEIPKSYVVIAVVVAVFFRFFGESSITILQRNVPIVTAVAISQDELEHYIQTKAAYLNESFQINAEDYKDSEFENKLDREAHEWFLQQNWRPQRFFYVENRLKMIVDLMQKRDEQKNEARFLEAQAKQLTQMSAEHGAIQDTKQLAAELLQKAQKIKYYIDRDLRMADVEKDEDLLVQEYRVNLTQLWEQ